MEWTERERSFVDTLLNGWVESVIDASIGWDPGWEHVESLTGVVMDARNAVMGVKGDRPCV